MRTVAQNRRARFDYEILETIETGVMLSGAEVKSCRGGKAHLAGAYVSIRDKEAILRGATIAPYPFAGTKGYDPTRERVLLLHRSEMERIQRCLQEKGMSVIPLEVRAGKFVKILIGIARGRKHHDKRERVRERETARRLRKGNE